MARFHCPKPKANDPKKECDYSTDLKSEMIDHAQKIHGAIFNKQTVKDVNYKKRTSQAPTVS